MRVPSIPIYSELNMGNPFHQIQMVKESQIASQTHKGLNRMKCLFLVPVNSKGIFHHQVTKAFLVLKGFITIYNNILIYRNYL